jgi:hypothetical protein
MPDVRITLEKPWAHDPMGKEIPVVLRYGSTPAREVGGGGSLMIGDESVSQDEFNDAGSHLDTVPRSVRRMIPGKRIEWSFSCSDKDQNGFFVPVEVAMLYFGNWKYRQGDVHDQPDETYGYERNRVAMKWGWWKMPAKGPSGLTHLRRGEEGPDTTKIGAPSVPHVLIESVDGRGKTTDSLKFRPWDFYKWDADVVPEFAMQPQTASASIEAFTPAQLRAIAEEIEARAASSKSKG